MDGEARPDRTAPGTGYLDSLEKDWGVVIPATHSKIVYY